MSRLHEPTPEFRARLESRIVGELASGASRPGALSRAAIVIAALALGALAGAAPAQVQQTLRRDALLQAARVEEQLMQLRYGLAREAYERSRLQFAVGELTQTSLLAAEAELRAMEAMLRKAQLRREEIALTAASARDEISAPLVDDRDFVAERLQLDLAAAQERFAAAERHLEDVQRRTQVGTATEAERLAAETEIVHARRELEMLGARLDLRREYVREDRDVADVERRLHRRELMIEIEAAQRLHELAKQRLATMRGLARAGRVDRLELMRTEVETLARALELEKLQDRLKALDAAHDLEDSD